MIRDGFGFLRGPIQEGTNKQNLSRRELSKRELSEDELLLVANARGRAARRGSVFVGELSVGNCPEGIVRGS